MNTSKKNGFFTFVLSLIPGAAHMYMGFMKMGLSLMGLFILSITVSSMLNMGILVFVIILTWFYSFFHALNLANLSDEQFDRMEDDFLFGIDSLSMSKITAEKYRKYFGIGMIVFGIILLWNVTIVRFLPRILSYFPEIVRDIYWRFSSMVPQFIIAIIIIVIGVKLLRGKQKALLGDENLGNEASGNETSGNVIPGNKIPCDTEGEIDGK